MAGSGSKLLGVEAGEVRSRCHCEAVAKSQQSANPTHKATQDTYDCEIEGGGSTVAVTDSASIGGSWAELEVSFLAHGPGWNSTPSTPQQSNQSSWRRQTDQHHLPAFTTYNSLCAAATATSLGVTCGRYHGVDKRTTRSQGQLAATPAPRDSL